MIFQKKQNTALLYIVVFLSVLLLYVLTLAPDLVWQDQGDYQYQVALKNLEREGDAVRVHPLFIVFAHYLARLTTLSYAYTANLTSAIFAALTAANVFLLVLYLTKKIYPSILSTAVLAFSHSFWFLAVQAQTYSMANAALTGGLVIYMAYINTSKQKYLYLLGLVFGLGLSVHMISQIGFAVICLWFVIMIIKKKIPLISLLKICLSWFVGAFLFWLVVWIEYSHSQSISATISSVIWGRWGNAVFNFNRVLVLIQKSILFFSLNFPTPLVLLAIPGLWFSLKQKSQKSFNFILVVLTVLYSVFAIRYDVPNQNSFFLPVYILVSMYIGIGYSFLFDSKRAQVVCMFLVLMILPAYPAFAHIAKAKEIEIGTKRSIPYRDVYDYYLIPWQQNQRGPRRLAKEVLSIIPENSVIISDTTIIPAFQYMHYIEKFRPDIHLYTIYDDFDSYRNLLNESKAFTFSDVKGYYPRWVESTEQLKVFPISDSECIFEIITDD